MVHNKKKKDEITKGFRILQQGGSHILCSPVTLAYTLFHLGFKRQPPYHKLVIHGMDALRWLENHDF